MESTPEEVLQGLDPSLVMLLVTLSGATDAEILETFNGKDHRLGDVAAMAAYKMVELVEDPETGDFRVARLNQLFYDVSRVAHDAHF